MALTGNITVAANMSLTADPIGSAAAVAQALRLEFLLAVTDGTTANKADRVYFKRLSLTTSATDIDLSGTLKDVFGNALVFAEVCGIFVKNNSVTLGESVLVGGNGAGLAEWVASPENTIVVKPGGSFSIMAPGDPAYAVVAGTGDILSVAAAAGTPTADVMILGRSA